MTDTRKFRMHPDLLFSVIKAQAGTLAKALMELVMNSVDAGASRIEIMMDDKGFHVTDNGRGFTSFEEIESFFETFGTPHKEGDAVYGRFRIGRGQAFAFARNLWRSGTFLMDVDIRGRGLDYTLVRDMEHQVGCSIVGHLYEPLLPSDLINTIQTLSEQCRYAQVPVIINNKQVSTLPAEVKWDHQTEEAYFKTAKTRTLSVYNLGVLVGHFHSGEFGIGGTVVSKKQLTLNFARNDVLRSECKVWKNIRTTLSRLATQMNGAGPKQQAITEEFREYQSRLMLAAKDQREFLENFAYEPLFTTTSGKHWSLRKLCSELRQTPKLCLSKRGDLLADRVTQHKLAIVLDQDLLGSRFRLSMPDLLNAIEAIPSKNVAPWQTSQVLAMVSTIRSALTNLLDFHDLFSLEHRIIPAADLTKAEELALQAIRSVSHFAAWILDVTPRQLAPAESDTALAFTNGVDTIWFNRKLLGGPDGPARGYAWAHRACSVLVHEYCHDENSGVGHTHDAEFYEAFHNAVTGEAFGKCVVDMFSYYVKYSERLAKKLSAKTLANLDHQAKNERTQSVIMTE